MSFLLAITCFSLTVSQASAQKVNSLYFLERTPIHTRMNPAMAPKNSGFGVGVSNFSFSLQSDLAMDDLFFPGANGELNTFLHPDVDKTAFLASLNDVSSFRGGMNIELFSLGIRAKNLYFSFHSGMNMDFGLGMPKDLLKIFLVGMDANAASTVFDLTSMNFNTMLYNKTGLGFSTKIGNIFSVGGNIDYLVGLANVRLGFDELTINASETNWEVTSKGYAQMAGPDQLSLTYSEDGYLNGIDTNFGSSIVGVASIVNAFPAAGGGLSVDLGVTAKPLPFLTLSAAITDLGTIRWNKNYIQKAASDGTFTYEGVTLNLGDGSNNEETGNQFAEQLQEMVRFEGVNITEGYTTRLTTKLNVGAEAGILKNHITLGLLSQTGFAENGVYQDLMVSANLKPGSMLQTAFTYSLLHGSLSSFGTAINVKLLFLNIFLAADYIPLKYTPQMVPISNSYFNMQMGVNFMF
jgi:hypothetical protein